MDYAYKLDFMDDDCDIEGFPIIATTINQCKKCGVFIITSEDEIIPLCDDCKRGLQSGDLF